MKNSKKIKQILILLADNNQFPLDMNELDESIFDEFNDTKAKAKQILNDAGYLTDGIWSVGDIEFRANLKKIELTKKQTFAIKDNIIRNFDIDNGINWDTIDSAIDEYFATIKL